MSDTTTLSGIADELLARQRELNGQLRELHEAITGNDALLREHADLAARIRALGRKIGESASAREAGEQALGEGNSDEALAKFDSSLDALPDSDTLDGIVKATEEALNRNGSSAPVVTKAPPAQTARPANQPNARKETPGRKASGGRNKNRDEKLDKILSVLDGIDAEEIRALLVCVSDAAEQLQVLGRYDADTLERVLRSRQKRDEFVKRFERRFPPRNTDSTSTHGQSDNGTPTD